MDENNQKVMVFNLIHTIAALGFSFCYKQLGLVTNKWVNQLFSDYSLWMWIWLFIMDLRWHEDDQWRAAKMWWSHLITLFCLLGCSHLVIISGVETLDPGIRQLKLKILTGLSAHWSYPTWFTECRAWWRHDPLRTKKSLSTPVAQKEGNVFCFIMLFYAKEIKGIPEVYSIGLTCKALSIVGDPTHPSTCVFSLLLSGRTDRPQNSFHQDAELH